MENEEIQTHCNDCGAKLCEYCGECHNGCFLSADACPESLNLESSEQCEYYAALAQIMTLVEAQKYQPGELIVCPE